MEDPIKRAWVVLADASHPAYLDELEAALKEIVSSIPGVTAATVMPYVIRSIEEDVGRKGIAVVPPPKEGEKT